MSSGEDKYWLSACLCSLLQRLPCNPDVKTYPGGKKTPSRLHHCSMSRRCCNITSSVLSEQVSKQSWICHVLTGTSLMEDLAFHVSVVTRDARYGLFPTMICSVMVYLKEFITCSAGVTCCAHSSSSSPFFSCIDKHRPTSEVNSTTVCRFKGRLVSSGSLVPLLYIVRLSVPPELHNK